MNIFRVNRLPLYQAPDAPPSGDGTIDPAAPPVDPAAPPAAGDPPAPELQPDPPAADGDHGNKGKKPWFLQRISEETEGRRAAEQRAADAEALAARLQAGNNPPPADGTRQPPPADPRDFNAAVRTEAQRMRLADDSMAVRDAGLRDFGASFGESLHILTAVGATSDDMVLDLIAVDKTNAHKILANLAKDPEKAASLVGMDSRRRIAELTRMADAIAAPKTEPTAPKPGAPPKQVSKAPAPAPPVDPSASKSVDWRSDEASDEEFDRGFKETMAKRSARR